MSQAVAFLVKQIEGIPWQGSVVLATPAKIIVNRGSREGVAVGQQFSVGQSEELTDPDTGEVLDVSMTQVATLKVTDVKEKIATCTVVTGDAAKVQKGMTVQLAP